MKLETWHLRPPNPIIPHVKTAKLYLYPELDCSACVDSADLLPPPEKSDG
jgi:hypothetical protein